MFDLISKVISTGFFKIDKIKSYLEIGVNEGDSLKMALSIFDSIEKLVLCDTWGNEYGGQDRGSHDHIIEILEERNFDLGEVEFLDGNSHELIPLYFVCNFGPMIDLSFVDGDHSVRGALKDLNNVVAYSNIIAFHDIRHKDHLYLKNVFYTFYSDHSDEFIMIDDGGDLGIMIRKDLVL